MLNQRGRSRTFVKEDKPAKLSKSAIKNLERQYASIVKDYEDKIEKLKDRLSKVNSELEESFIKENERIQSLLEKAENNYAESDEIVNQVKVSRDKFEEEKSDFETYKNSVEENLKKREDRLSAQNEEVTKDAHLNHQKKIELSEKETQLQ